MQENNTKYKQYINQYQRYSKKYIRTVGILVSFSRKTNIEIIQNIFKNYNVYNKQYDKNNFDI